MMSKAKPRVSNKVIRGKTECEVALLTRWDLAQSTELVDFNKIQ